MQMTLDKIKKGQQVVIRSIEDEQVRVQATRFGISEGAVVKCQEIVPAGPIIVSKAKQEIAIGRNLARNIEVDLLR